MPGWDLGGTRPPHGPQAGMEEDEGWEEYDPHAWESSPYLTGPLPEGNSMGASSSEAPKRPRLPEKALEDCPESGHGTQEPISSSSSEAWGPWKKQRVPFVNPPDEDKVDSFVAYGELISRFWEGQIPLATLEKRAGTEYQGSMTVRKPEYLDSQVSFIRTPCEGCDACSTMPRETPDKARYAAGICLFRQAVQADWVSGEVYRDVARAPRSTPVA